MGEEMQSLGRLTGSSGWQSFIPVQSAPKGVIRLVLVGSDVPPSGTVVGVVSVEDVTYHSESVFAPGTNYPQSVSRALIVRNSYLVVVEEADDALARMTGQVAHAAAAREVAEKALAASKKETETAQGEAKQWRESCERANAYHSEAVNYLTAEREVKRKMEADLAKIRRAIGDVAFEAAVGRTS